MVEFQSMVLKPNSVHVKVCKLADWIVHKLTHSVTRIEHRPQSCEKKSTQPKS